MFHFEIILRVDEKNAWLPNFRGDYRGSPGRAWGRLCLCPAEQKDLAQAVGECFTHAASVFPEATVMEIWLTGLWHRKEIVFRNYPLEVLG